MFDTEVDILGGFGYYLPIKDQCDELKEEEYEMFNFKEYSWKHYGARSNDKLGKMIIRHFDQLGVYFFSDRFSFDDFRQFSPETKKNTDVRGRVGDLLFGFPSFKVPESSDSFFWWLKGDHFGGEHTVNGEWKVSALKDIARDGEGLDGGPVMLVHKNEKDVIIISPASLASFYSYLDYWIYTKDNAYSMLLEAAARLKLKTPVEDETCFVEQLDLEFGTSRGARSHIGGAYEEFVKKREDGTGFVPFESTTILVTSNQGPRAAIAKWGDMIKVFGAMGLSDDCPCSTFKEDIEKNDFPQHAKAMFTTAVGSYYDGLVTKDGKTQVDLSGELMELGKELVGGDAPVLVNYFHLADWWADTDEFGLKKYMNNRNNIWGPPSLEPPQTEPPSCDRWGTAKIYYELSRNYNLNFGMDCEYGFPTAKLESVPQLQDQYLCERVDANVRQEKIHSEPYSRNKVCWNAEIKGGDTDSHIPCPYRDECWYGGITIVNDRQYWKALPEIKNYNTRSDIFFNDRWSGCSQMTIRYTKEVLNQHCRANLEIGGGEEWLFTMHEGLSNAAVPAGTRPKKGIGMTFANANPRIGIYAALLTHVHSLEVTSPFNFDYGLTGLFTNALGLRPMTGPILSGEYDGLNNYQYQKIDAEFQIAAVTLSTGPVRFGDQKGKFKWAILSKCCRNDGVILKPDVPAAPMDADLAGIGSKENGLGKGTEIPSLQGADENTEFYYIRSQPTRGNKCSYTSSDATFTFTPQSNYSLTTFAEITLLNDRKFAFLGDFSKIVGISKQRFEKFVSNNNAGKFTFSTLATSANLKDEKPLEDDLLELSACFDGELIQRMENYFVKFARDANFSFDATSKSFVCESPETCYKGPEVPDDKCPDEELYDECYTICRLNYLQCRSECSDHLCENACLAEFSECSSSCPCGEKCPNGCDSCENPICLENCEAAETDNENYIECREDALEFHTNCIRLCPPDRDCFDECNKELVMTLNTCPCVEQNKEL
ncbi:Oidioi.mRNA.OKI2018_I69.chr1.g3918.t1.cds [Oikopleura dioica]|uniref:Oidioi.mRNA.OKI2018_I69.chr1.g3918.t1.cds n=1 Tax=Oikopleura dioica TaxID=34765 RepID=A0ABN7T4T6_OIKDI|nr:Oidioi.mRNA.OKI2018_I69.chr1.g3918.t1.cds [Oikopleura dioica]